MSSVSLRGITIGFDEHGEGDDVVLFVHGHPFNRSMWDPQISAVTSAGWRVLIPDLRGYGESTVVPGKVPLHVFAEDLAALLDYRVAKNAVLCGLSMGGQIVMEFVRQFPNRVSGVALAATSPLAETEDGKRNRMAMADRLVHEGMRPYATEVLPRMLATTSIERFPEVATHVMHMMRSTDPRGAAAALRGRAERPSYEATLASIAVPAIVIVGSEDAFTTRADLKRMGELIKGAKSILIDGSGHMPNLECSHTFNSELLALLERVRRGPPVRV